MGQGFLLQDAGGAEKCLGPLSEVVDETSVLGMRDIVRREEPGFVDASILGIREHGLYARASEDASG